MSISLVGMYSCIKLQDFMEVDDKASLAREMDYSSQEKVESIKIYGELINFLLVVSPLRSLFFILEQTQSIF